MVLTRAEIRRIASKEKLCAVENHEEDHSERVINYSEMIAASIGYTDYQAVWVAGFFHDTGRQGMLQDRYHGHRSAEILRYAVEKYWSEEKIDLESHVWAFEHHSDIIAPNGDFPVVKNYDVPSYVDPNIAVILWDADRLDLARCSFLWPKIHDKLPGYFNTDLARNFFKSQEHMCRYSNCRN